MKGIAARFMGLVGTLLLVAVVLAALPPRAAWAETGAPADTPVPVVQDVVDEWAVGGGLLYWANSCFAEEFPPPSTIRRKPVGGGSVVLLEQTPAADCLTYLNIAAADDGVYYLDDRAGRLERIPTSPPYTPLPVVDVPANQKPTIGSALEIAGNYVYWVSSDALAIYRVRRDGTGSIELVANTSATPLDVMVIGSTVYWVDSAGVQYIRVDCGEPLPCSETQDYYAAFAANTSGFGLLYRTGTGFNRFSYTVSWVERSGNIYSIRQRTCSTIIPCGDTTTFHSAATGWVIGPPVSDGTSFFWTERFFSVTTPDGKVRRKALAGGDAVDIAVSLPQIDRRLAIAIGNVYFATAGPQPGIYMLPLNASAILRDLTADAWEITQGIQNTANTVPLVANKTTYVRLYGKELSGPNTIVTEARLVGTRNGIPLPGSPLAPLNGTRTLQTGGTYDRARLNDGWYFLLPASWINGTIVLQAEVDPRQAYSDPDRTNNALTANITFQNQPPVCVWTVPVRTHTPRPSTTDPNFWAMVNQFEQRWPVPDVWIYRDTNPVEELQVCFKYGFIPYPCYGPYELEDGWSITNGPPDRDKVILSLWTRAQLTFNPDACDDIGAPVHFMGMVHPDANNGGAAGYASTVSNQSWVQLPAHVPNPMPDFWFSVQEGNVMAQELAHNQGRKHVNCGNPDNVDNNYPYPPCQIAPTGPTSFYGFAVRTLTPIRPDAAADFMSYSHLIGRSQWVSDYTWRALLNSFALNRAPVTPRVLDANEVVYAAGFIDMAVNEGYLSYLLVLPQETLPPQALAAPQADDAPQVNYTLRLLDANQTVLHEEPLVLQIIDDHSAESNPALFSAVFAPPAGQVVMVQLLADGAVLDSLSFGPHTPTVAIQQPTGSAVISSDLTIQWTASDPDSDPLLFTVQYSYDDGAHWHTLINDFPASPSGTNTLALADLGSLPGSNGQTARIRVIASDSYHTATALSDAFTVPNRPPTAAIIAPANGETLAAHDPVVLRGNALDPEDGGLSGDALVWAVDNQAAGTGSDVAVLGLAPGNHTARLTATDANANAGTAQVTFAIAPLGVPQTAAPTLDGFCDDPAYASAVVVSLAPYDSGEQATVRLVRTDTHLWACFGGLRKGASSPGARAGLRVDVDNSGDPLAGGDDYGFFAGEDGAVLSLKGDGAGDFIPGGPSGLQAQVSSSTDTWSAELRIEAVALGGLDRTVNLALGHYDVSTAGNDYAWPYRATAAQPPTWGLAVLGASPVLESLDRVSATAGEPAFTLTVTGSSLISGTVVLWNGTPLATTFVDGETLTAAVTGAQLGSAGTATIAARSPGAVVSNGLPLVVYGAAPSITSVTPGSAPAGSPQTTLTITGANFAADAQVLWNGEPLPTTFGNAGQLTAQVSAAQLAQAQTAGLAVRNPTPVPQVSSAVTFTVEPLAFIAFLPLQLR